MTRGTRNITAIFCIVKKIQTLVYLNNKKTILQHNSAIANQIIYYYTAQVHIRYLIY